MYLNWLLNLRHLRNSQDSSVFAADILSLRRTPDDEMRCRIALVAASLCFDVAQGVSFFRDTEIWCAYTSSSKRGMTLALAEGKPRECFRASDKWWRDGFSVLVCMRVEIMKYSEMEIWLKCCNGIDDLARGSRASARDSFGSSIPGRQDESGSHARLIERFGCRSQNEADELMP